MKCKGGEDENIHEREKLFCELIKKKKQETHLRQEELTSTHFLFLSTYDIYFGSISRLTHVTCAHTHSTSPLLALYYTIF